MEVEVRFDHERGCGWRKPGGLYLVAEDQSRPCGRLPIAAETCPCCGRGIRPSRAWTWVDGDEILRAAPECVIRGQMECETCPIHEFARHGIGRVGLIWIGERYYPTPAHFDREAERLGISRRITALPRGFEIGKTWVMLAHRKAILSAPLEIGGEVRFKPGIFRIFKPKAVEVILTGDESDEQIERHLNRGLTPVMVQRVTSESDQMEIVSVYRKVS